MKSIDSQVRSLKSSAAGGVREGKTDRDGSAMAVWRKEESHDSM